MTTATWIDRNHDAFLNWLTTQRWYGDKSRTVRELSVQELGNASVDGVDISLLAVRIAFDHDDVASYITPMVQQAEGSPEDATAVNGFLRWLASGFEDNRGLPLNPEQGALVWRPRSPDGAWTRQTPTLLRGEQSNSSVIFGSSAILKLFRKYQPGINPDSEIVSFLTAEGSFANAPTFLGSIVQVRDDSHEDIEIATVQSFVANEGDCWRWLPPALVATAGANRDSLTEAVGLLGQRTGEMHVALSSGTDEAFAPESWSETEIQDFVGRLAREVKLTASMLFQQGAMSHGDEESLVSGLIANVTDADVLLGSNRIRVHGDYHLGQVLRTAEDFVIIDFEGEPSRPMEERRQKHAPLKDVAGMLRSIDYAVATASQDLDAQEVATLRKWGMEAGARFVSRYRQEAIRSRVPLIPPGKKAFETALDLFMTEKALYEVRYELDNRPAWLDIPLSALQRIAMKV